MSPGLTSPNTTRNSIIAQWGDAVSNTHTINWTFDNGVFIEGAGFLLNNEMDDFSAKPGVPNIYSVVGSYANEIQSGKRPLSSMSPTILRESDEVMMVVGTLGAQPFLSPYSRLSSTLSILE